MFVIPMCLSNTVYINIKYQSKNDNLLNKPRGSNYLINYCVLTDILGRFHPLTGHDGP